MYKGLFSLALQGIRRKKRSSRLVFSILLVSFAFAILSLSLVTSISRTNEEFVLNTYGAWYLGIPSGMEEDEVWLNDQPWVNAVGKVMNYGSVRTKSRVIGIGAMDDTMRELGHIRLSEGRWPEADGEIVIEASALHDLGYEPVVGQEISLDLMTHRMGPDGVKYRIPAKCTVTGILCEYTKLWQLEHDPEEQGLISVVCTHEYLDRLLSEGVMTGDHAELSNSKPRPQYFISMDIEEEKGREDAFVALTAYMEETRTDSVAAARPCRNLSILSIVREKPQVNFYTSMIVGVALVAVLCAYIMQLPTEIKSFATLRSIGITKSQLAVLLLTGSAFLALPAMLSAIPLGAGLSWITLRLLVYSGCAPIRVSVPYELLFPLAAMWLIMVLVSRFTVFLVTIHTPLVGRFQLSAAKARRARHLRQALIGVLLVSFGAIVTFTALEALLPTHLMTSAKTYPTYVLSETRSNKQGSSVSQGDQVGDLWVLNDRDICFLEQIPGIYDADGLSEVQVTLSFDGFRQKVWLYAIDETAWTFPLGTRQEDFHKGGFCLLCFPEGFLGTPQTDDLLPSGPVTVSIDHQITDTVECIARSEPTEVSIFEVTESFKTRNVPYLREPYTLVCSHAYLERLISSIDPGIRWEHFVSGEDYCYERIFAMIEPNITDNSCDTLVEDYADQKRVSFLGFRERNMVWIQEHTQKLILLGTGGGSIALVLLLILNSALALESEQEKRRYGILRTLGMSRRQMRRDILGRGLGRTALAVSGGTVICWVIGIAHYSFTPKFLFVTLGTAIVVVLAMCLLGKRRLLKGELPR